MSCVQGVYDVVVPLIMVGGTFLREEEDMHNQSRDRVLSVKTEKVNVCRGASGQ